MFNFKLNQMSNCDLILLAEDDEIKEVDEKDSFLANSDLKSTSDKFNEKLKENELKPNHYSNPNQPKDRYCIVNLFSFIYFIINLLTIQLLIQLIFTQIY